MVREPGRYLARVLASCVDFFNPGVMVIGEDVAIEASRPGDRAGVVDRVVQAGAAA